MLAVRGEPYPALGEEISSEGAVDAGEGTGGAGTLPADTDPATGHVLDRAHDAVLRRPIALNLETALDHSLRTAIDEGDPLLLGPSPTLLATIVDFACVAPTWPVKFASESHRLN